MDNEYSVEDCYKCSELVESRSQIVNGVGSIDSDILVIGEAPGENEDEEGEPFVGRSGEKLTEALLNCGVSRSDIRITNTVRCHPPENRDPRKEERENCRQYLYNEILSVNPEVIIPVGKVPSETVLNRSVSVTKESGRRTQATIPIKESEEVFDVIICVHPAAMFYNRELESVFYKTIERAVELAKK